MSVRPAKLTCPNAKYNSRMYIECAKDGGECAHQRWCAGKGWCVLTEQAADCPARREDDHEQRAKTVKKRRDEV